MLFRLKKKIISLPHFGQRKQKEEKGMKMTRKKLTEIPSNSAIISCCK